MWLSSAGYKRQHLLTDSASTLQLNTNCIIYCGIEQIEMKLTALVFIISTVIAATAAARVPTDPGFQGLPYFQQSEPLPLMQKQYSEPPQEIEPPQEMCGDNGLACVQYRTYGTVGVKSLTVGQIVEVQYLAPNSGRVSVNLRAANNDYILHADSRINWNSYKDHYLLYSYTNGQWHQEQTVHGFPFTCPPVPNLITVRIAVMPNKFAVNVNGMTLATHQFGGSVSPDRVSRVECALDDNNASIKGRVEKVTVSF